VKLSPKKEKNIYCTKENQSDIQVAKAHEKMFNIITSREMKKLKATPQRETIHTL
jgi:hypothetical protein